MDMSHTTEVMAILVRFFAYFGQISLPWKRPLEWLRLFPSEMSFFRLADHKTPCICYDVLIISRRNAFIAILVPNWLPW